MANISKINLNGSEYNIVDSAATLAIQTEVTRATAAESANTAAIATEVTARQSGDTILQNAINTKADAATTYSKTDVDNLLAAAATATTQEISSAVSGKQDTLTAGTGIDITNNVISCTIDSGLYVVVQTLPAQPAAGNENKIHLVPLASSAQTQNDKYEEYLWKGTEWEYLGVKQVEIDLSDYWTSAQTQAAITAATSGKVDTSVYSAYTATTNSAISGLQTSVSGLTSGIGENVLEYGGVEAVLSSAGVAELVDDGESDPYYQVNNVVSDANITNYVTASYDSETETLFLTIPEITEGE